MTLPSRRTILVASAALTATGAAAGYARLGGWAEHDPALVFSDGGFAVRGYDPVAYFREGGPIAGDDAFTAHWNGAAWRFASAANRDAFLAQPGAYAPQYGGFCAWAVAARGELYSTRPQNWSIVGGRLFLNFNDKIQRRWEQDIPGFIAEGDRRWPEIVAGA